MSGCGYSQGLQWHQLAGRLYCNFKQYLSKLLLRFLLLRLLMWSKYPCNVLRVVIIPHMSLMFTKTFNTGIFCKIVFLKLDNYMNHNLSTCNSAYFLNAKYSFNAALMNTCRIRWVSLHLLVHSSVKARTCENSRNIAVLFTKDRIKTLLHLTEDDSPLPHSDAAPALPS